MNYIDIECDQMIIKEDNKISLDLSFDIREEIEKKMNYQLNKASIA